MFCAMIEDKEVFWFNLEGKVMIFALPVEGDDKVDIADKFSIGATIPVGLLILDEAVGRKCARALAMGLGIVSSEDLCGTVGMMGSTK